MRGSAQRGWEQEARPRAVAGCRPASFAARADTAARCALTTAPAHALRRGAASRTVAGRRAITGKVVEKGTVQKGRASAVGDLRSRFHWRHRPAAPVRSVANAVVVVHLGAVLTHTIILGQRLE